jgi:hypothetical protein
MYQQQATAEIVEHAQEVLPLRYWREQRDYNGSTPVWLR